jgi:hypothetical protein
MQLSTLPFYNHLPMSITQRSYWSWIALLAILSTSAVLYGPWISNPPVFDDPPLLTSPTLFEDYAVKFFSLQPRHFPYFTLGFEQVITGGNLRISRIVALVLHGLNGYLLFFLCRRLLAKLVEPNKAFLLALGVGLIFTAHPVAVYAVGYWVQRTILFAAFFLLLSAIQFDIALERSSWQRALFAGVLYGLAALSKEHAMPGLLSVLALAWIPPRNSIKENLPVLSAFCAIALPISIWVIFVKLGIIGTTYEPDVQEIIGTSGFPDTGSSLGNWALSASLQCDFFFRYLAFWLWPDPIGISIDIRPDFAYLSHSFWLVLGPLAWIASALFIINRLMTQQARSSFGLIAFGLLWAMTLFTVELSSVRFQEPVVLYRSYLWAPGFLLAVIGLLSTLRTTPVYLGLILALTCLFPLSNERLTTFSKELNLWEEAAEKLPSLTTPGAIRIIYNRGIFRLRTGHIQQAGDDFEWIVQTDPNVVQGFIGRAAFRVATKDWTGAADDLRIAIKLRPQSAVLHYRLGLVLKKIGKEKEADDAFSAAQGMGMQIPK